MTYSPEEILKWMNEGKIHFSAGSENATNERVSQEIAKTLNQLSEEHELDEDEMND